MCEQSMKGFWVMFYWITLPNLVWQKRSNLYCALILTAVFKSDQATLTAISFQVALNFWCYFPYKGATKHVYVTSLWKHPFLLTLLRWGHFARRNICNCFSYCLRMTDKRQKATKVKCKHKEALTKQSIFVEYSLLYKKHLSFCWSLWAD